jgi:hypothetical protein
MPTPRAVEVARARLRQAQMSDQDLKSVLEAAWQRILSVSEFDPRRPGLTPAEIAQAEAARTRLRRWSDEIEAGR